MSDPLTEEEKELRKESYWDRPEGRAQEEAHAEAGEDVVMEQQGKNANDKAPSLEQNMREDLEHVTTNNGNVTNRETVDSDSQSHAQPDSQPTAEESNAEPQQDEESEEFDYLAYAQDRAMFFWGDCIQMGVVNKEDLPEELRERVKIVPY